MVRRMFRLFTVNKRNILLIWQSVSQCILSMLNYIIRGRIGQENKKKGGGLISLLIRECTFMYSCTVLLRSVHTHTHANSLLFEKAKIYNHQVRRMNYTFSLTTSSNRLQNLALPPHPHPPQDLHSVLPAPDTSPALGAKIKDRKIINGKVFLAGYL